MADTFTSSYTTSMNTNIFEDVDNMVFNVSPHDHPFISSLRRGRAQNTKVEWVEDSDRPASANAHKEVEDASFSESATCTRVSNYTQIFRETYSVSDTLDAVSAIGRASESKYRLAKAIKAVGDDMEMAMLNNATATAGDAATPRQTKGALGFVSTNKYAPAGYSTANQFTEAVFLDLMQNCWNVGGQPSRLLAPPNQIRKVIAWTQAQRQTINQDASERKLVMDVVLLQTPFGTVKVMPERFFTADDQGGGNVYDSVLLYNPDRFELALLRDVAMRELARTGNYGKYLVEGEAALKCRNEKANAKAVKLSRA